jgi:hypothetical protein
VLKLVYGQHQDTVPYALTHLGQELVLKDVLRVVAESFWSAGRDIKTIVLEPIGDLCRQLQQELPSPGSRDGSDALAVAQDRRVALVIQLFLRSVSMPEKPLTYTFM